MVLGGPGALGDELSHQIAANTRRTSDPGIRLRREHARAAARLKSGSAMTQPQDGDDLLPGKLPTYTLAR
jgi:hypothetical protein